MALVKKIYWKDQVVVIGGLIRLTVRRRNGQTVMVIDAPDGVKIDVQDTAFAQDSGDLVQPPQPVVSKP